VIYRSGSIGNHPAAVGYRFGCRRDWSVSRINRHGGLPASGCRGTARAPAASSRALASLASCWTRLFWLGHEISGDGFPLKKIRVVVPNDALLMHGVSGKASSGPEARNVAKKFVTIVSGSFLLWTASPCSSFAVPSDARVSVNPRVFVEPEFTIRTSESIGIHISPSIALATTAEIHHARSAKVVVHFACIAKRPAIAMGFRIK
jgi:hypothetical protein